MPRRVPFTSIGAAFATAVFTLCCAQGDRPAVAAERANAQAGTPASSASPAAAARGIGPAGPLPGAPAMDAETVKALEKAWKGRKPGYEPRTKHLHPDGSPKYINRLLLQPSPYLLQHAHNPVNWYPWGDEAFETAKQLNRPVLLSVGYSTCHWCHVMEEESFDDEEIARFMNENYVAIKVDREERPDVDSVYMAAVQSISGRGGWPMTVWLTPDRKPFHGGTYFPARDGDRGARVGFLTLLDRLKTVYEKQPDNIANAARAITNSVRENLSSDHTGGLPGPETLQALVDDYWNRFDNANGGIRRAPKFPSNIPVRALLRHHRRAGGDRSLKMAELTLEKMAGGGMYDHAGGGFHRYSTDRVWLVPHFEKMLYDNALLTVAYLEGFQVTGREDFARVAREILRYVRRDMTSPEGAFYSATDADSLTPDGHREEGWFFTWTPAEIEAVLTPEQARVVKAYYAVTAGGNFEKRNILHTPKPLEEVAKELGLAPAKMRTVVEASREALYQARKARPAPLRDDKILTAWNGLMISAFAQGALVLGDASYARDAERAAAFILGTMRTKDGRLLRSSRDGRAHLNAYVEDYAFLVAGLLDLYEATGDATWLTEAIALDAVVRMRYEDAEKGGFFTTSDDHETLLAREKSSYDGAEPTGNSIHTLNLFRLYEFTTNDTYRERGEKALKAFGALLKRSPSVLSEMLLAVDYRLDTPKEVVIITAGGRDEAAPFLARMRETFLPNRILVVAEERETRGELKKTVPIVERKVARKNEATAYVCENRVCKLPTTDPAVFAEQIATVEPLVAPEAPGGEAP